MNSNRPQPEQPAFGDWLSRAKHWRPNAVISGTGRFAVRLMDGKNIRLFERFEEAVAFTSADPIRRFTDLATIRTIEEILDAMPETPENR